MVKNRLRSKSLQILFFITLCSLTIQIAQATSQITLYPIKDNTLYETAAGNNSSGEPLERSNGIGDYLFVGRTGLDAGYKLRRAAIAFDIATAIPADSTILYAQLSLTLSKAPTSGAPPPMMTNLHRALADWGEGTSHAFGPEGQGEFPADDDVTWHQRFYNLVPDALWSTPGGDFVASESVSTTVGTILGEYTWICTAQMITDLQLWLDNPAENFGWIVTGDAGGTSARRFNSRENVIPNTQPILTIIYRKPEVILNDRFDSPPSCDE